MPTGPDGAVLRDLRERAGEPATRTQFIVAMATYMGVVGRLPAKVTLPMAATAFGAFTTENRTIFGDPDFAWDLAAACTVAHEYEVAHWPSDPALLTAKPALKQGGSDVG